VAIWHQVMTLGSMCCCCDVVWGIQNRGKSRVFYAFSEAGRLRTWFAGEL